jgi:thioredoxin reductase (NADPH)
VYAASEGLKTVVLDQLGPGGQAGGSSRIENFIGFPAGLSGTDLATRGVLQMLKFGAAMIAPVTVNSFEAAADDASPHRLHLDCGTTISARTVLAATGVRWRRLEAEGAERFERSGVYYACTAVEARLYDEQDVAVVGGGNSAGQAVMFLAEQCRKRTVHLVIRRTLDQGMSEYLVNRIRGTSNVKVHEGSVVSAVRGERALGRFELCASGGGGDKAEVPCAAVFVFIGAEPHADWLPASVARDLAGYVLTGTDVAKSGLWPLAHRDPCPLETTVPGLLAGGDLRAGSTKRVGFAVGDGSLAVTCAHRLRMPVA